MHVSLNTDNSFTHLNRQIFNTDDDRYSLEMACVKISRDPNHWKFYSKLQRRSRKIYYI